MILDLFSLLYYDTVDRKKNMIHKCSTLTKATAYSYQFGLIHPGICQLSMGSIPVQ